MTSTRNWTALISKSLGEVSNKTDEWVIKLKTERPFFGNGLKFIVFHNNKQMSAVIIFGLLSPVRLFVLDVLDRPPVRPRHCYGWYYPCISYCFVALPFRLASFTSSRPVSPNRLWLGIFGCHLSRWLLVNQTLSSPCKSSAHDWYTML